MSEQRPTGSKHDVQCVFSKVVVHDLDAMAQFYEEVFGLVPFDRHQDVMFGREIDEVTFQSTYPGGPALTLIKYLDSERASSGESIQGFTTTDLEALIGRAKAMGGRIAEPVRHIEQYKLKVVFVLDPEGHINEVVQMDE